MYVKRDIEVRSSNHCCSRRARSIRSSEYVFVALGIQHAMLIRHIVMWPAQLYSIFPLYLINGAILEKKRRY